MQEKWADIPSADSLVAAVDLLSIRSARYQRLCASAPCRPHTSCVLKRGEGETINTPVHHHSVHVEAALTLA